MFNRAELIGRLGRDPEVRYTTEGKAITQLAMATHEVHRDPVNGEKVRHTEWHRIVLFGRQAEVAGQYLKKGALAHVEGTLRTRRWKNKAGIEVMNTEIVAGTLTLLEKGPGAYNEEETKAIELEVDPDLGFEDFSLPPY